MAGRTFIDEYYVGQVRSGRPGKRQSFRPRAAIHVRDKTRDLVHLAIPLS